VDSVRTVPEHTAGLTRAVHRVTSVAMGDGTSYAGGTLTVSAAEAESVLADPVLASVRVTWASPGDSARIVKVLDAVEPRTKGPGGGGIFPGFLGPARAQGRGTTHVLRGATVVAAGYLPRAQEAVVEMSGPVAELSPLGSRHNLVVEFTPAEGAPWEDVDRASGAACSPSPPAWPTPRSTPSLTRWRSCRPSAAVTVTVTVTVT
jgi:hypothetical protein